MPPITLTFLLLLALLLSIGGIIGGLMAYFWLTRREQELLREIAELQALMPQLRQELEVLRLQESQAQQQLKAEHAQLATTASERDTAQKEALSLSASLQSVQKQLHSSQVAHTELQKTLETTKRDLTTEQTHRHNREKVLDEKMSLLETSRRHFESERERFRQAREQERLQREENSSREWNDHEETVLQRLRTLCRRPEIRFPLYENTSLPPAIAELGLKPDALIELTEGQYVVLDMKRSKTPKTYIPQQAKSTAQKYLSAESLWRTIYFILPSQNLAELPERLFEVGGFRFVCIDEASLEGVLLTLRRLSDYIRVEDLTPQERDSIVTLLAQYEAELYLHGSVNTVLTQRFLRLQGEGSTTLPESFSRDLEHKRSTLGPSSLPSRTEVTRLARSPETLASALTDLQISRAPLPPQHLPVAQSLIDSSHQHEVSTEKVTPSSRQTTDS